MNSVIGKWGNSSAVRLPAAILSQAGLSPQDKITLSVLDGRIVIEKTQDASYDLDELLTAITPENQQTEVDFGHPVGKELL